MSVLRPNCGTSGQKQGRGVDVAATLKGQVATSQSMPIAPVFQSALRPGVREYLQILESRDGLRALHHGVLRSGSTGARELLAAVASESTLTWAAVHDAVLAWSADRNLRAPVVRLIGTLPPRKLLTLARVVALQNLFPSDRRVAYFLYRLILEQRGERAFVKPHQKLLADLALRLGDYAFVEKALQGFSFDDLELASLRSDEMNPFLRPGLEEDAWLAALNDLIVPFGAEPIRLSLDKNGNKKPFDRLSTRPLRYVEGGVKVTVAITTWRPNSDEFSTAFRSISEQTWRNLEIVVVDDCSPPEFAPLLERVVASDPRARLVRMPRNGGTYLARNRALAEASGEYFTVHDSDDWAHPQRIEFQARRLQERIDLVSTGSRALRVDDRLLFNFPGASPSRENASSLMFRRAPVLSAIGYYDASRKGADSEFGVRMAQHFGASSHELLRQHLAFIRLSPGSLSREEFKPGWRHPSRTTYRLGYQWAHAKCKAVRRPLCVGRDGSGLGIVRPLRFLVDQKSREAERRREWDVVFAFDARELAKQPRGVIDEMLELARLGPRVAMMHMESLLYPAVSPVVPYPPELQDLVSRGVIGEVLPNDDVKVGSLVVRDPSVLQFIHPLRLAMKVSRVLLTPDEPAFEQDQPRTFTVLAVEDNAFQLFGREPVWLTLDLARTRGSGGVVGSQKCESRTWFGVRSVECWRAPRPALEQGSLRVGQALSGSGLVDADEQVIHRSCLFGAPQVTRIAFVVSPSTTLPEFIQREFPQATVERAESPEKRFFALTDVFLLHGNDPSDAASRLNAIEAAVSGCIVLWDPEWVGLLGEGPLCRLPQDVPAFYEALCASVELQQEYRTATLNAFRLEQDVLKMAGQLCPDHNIHKRIARRHLGA